MKDKTLKTYDKTPVTIFNNKFNFNDC